MDVTDSQSVAEAVSTAATGPSTQRYSPQASRRMAPLLETTDDDWHAQMNVNAFGVLNCLRALVPVMPKGGSIAVIVSMGGLRGAPYLSAYCASKFAVSGLIESATPELAVRDIRINGICPMYVRTPMEARELEWEGRLRGMTPEQVFDEYESTTPLGRVAEPAEMAAVAAFLVSDGQQLHDRVAHSRKRRCPSGIHSRKERRMKRRMRGLIVGVIAAVTAALLGGCTATAGNDSAAGDSIRVIAQSGGPGDALKDAADDVEQDARHQGQRRPVRL